MKANNQEQTRKGIRRSVLEWSIATLAVVMLIAGCQTTGTTGVSRSTSSTGTPVASSASVSATPAHAQTQDMKTPGQIILDMHASGKITDVQAARLMVALFGVDLQPAGGQDSTPKAMAETTTAKVDDASGLGGYTPENTLAGRLRSVGSDTMDKLMLLWEGGFRQYHPGLRFYHEGKGSSTAPPALMEGRSDFGPMSRALKDSEIAEFREKFGYEPMQMRVAVDSLAVYLHPDNPLAEAGLNFQQLDAIFSSTRNRGGKDDITTWGDLGLTGEWANAPIHVYTRNKASGTYAFFRGSVLKKGEYKSTNREMVGSEALVEAIANDRFGIGYSGIGYKTPNVAVAPLAENPGDPMMPAEQKYAYSGDYPLARFLYMTINNRPGTKPSPLHREFLSYVYSLEGQALVTQDGYYPVSKEIAEEELTRLQLQ